MNDVQRQELTAFLRENAGRFFIITDIDVDFSSTSSVIRLISDDISQVILETERVLAQNPDSNLKIGDSGLSFSSIINVNIIDIGTPIFFSTVSTT